MISIITPCFNNEQTLERAYKSILSIGISEFEWIVVDDQSSDDSFGKISSLASSDSRITAVQNLKNRGAGFSRNRGIDLALGDLICFLDADDEFLPEKSLQIKNMEAGSISAGCYFVLDEFGRSHLRDNEFCRPVGFDDLLFKRVTFGTSTVVICSSRLKDSVKRFGSQKRGQDFLFWLSLLQTGPPAIFHTEPIAVYHLSRGSLSSNKGLKAISHVSNLLSIEGLSSSKFFLAFFCYVVEGLRNKLKSKSRFK